MESCMPINPGNRELRSPSLTRGNSYLVRKRKAKKREKSYAVSRTSKDGEQRIEVTEEFKRMNIDILVITGTHNKGKWNKIH